ncbi:hypothetical protein ERO13_D08G142350v2 [Gossypium hirsutum]|uniref:RING-type E3 ubiquitin transferase n=2 Tax=Gossypium TaxID=3633 RepID=A0A5J5QEA5_GOSBA|nr:hypothetical protein ES319_D08G152600v1 [Gossypium barbadense]KAG4134203.1 hypothetical protein ERO13_D08G142350v2 [Gossypium hirsutum]TYG57682.1 hypothetical protein ES288_D08G162300v1 [Gossypium darwinii]
MDDSCAVCAETLEWVAYGACGHRDVCSNCVARLRFICNNRRCCICKTESDVIFVTKSLGDYTSLVNDFSVLPYDVREGRMGSYWYHEDTQAFFDDVDHYEMIKAMCKLSCTVCDKMEDRSNDGMKRRVQFRNIDQLKNHLIHRHRRAMCSLCLAGRKVFICEQKLYTRAQLNQHINTGNSEVDGTESERGGFMGHPKCVFCNTPFYGESELYSHMSIEHYTCHICQRRHPGHNKYYKNYDDLEIHFRLDHYLCEDEVCLAKKFIVFKSVADLKRHNTSEHGGRMFRARCNTALQIPTSSQHHRNNEDNRYGRGRTVRRQPSDNDYQLSMAIEASLRTANVPSASSTVLVVSAHGDTNDVHPFESLSTTDPESSSRYLQALGAGSRGAPFQASSFPPLPMVPSTSRQKSKQGSEDNTKQAHLPCQKNKNEKSFSLVQALAMQASSSSSQITKTTNIAAVASPVTGKGVAELSYTSSSHAQVQTQSTTADILTESGSGMSSGNVSMISHSSSAPNHANGGNPESEPLVSGFPPVCGAQRHKHSSSSRVLRIVEETFGLAHLFQKQTQLTDAYNANLESNVLQLKGGADGSVKLTYNNVF